MGWGEAEAVTVSAVETDGRADRLEIQRSKHCIRDGAGDFFLLFIVERIVLLIVQKAGFNQKSRHFRPPQNNKPWPCLDTEIPESQLRERAVNVFCHCLFDAGVVIDKRFHAGILVRFFRRIPVKRNKKVGIRLIGHLRLFKRRLINIGCAGINDRDTLPGKKLADRDGEGKIVILFPASLIDSARITSPVSGIDYDSIGHKIKAPENTVLLTI